MPKPPPWAYPLWTAQEVYRNSNDRMSRSTSQAIDQAMAHLWEAKVKFVQVSFSVENRPFDRPKNMGSLDLDPGVCRGSRRSASREENDNDLEWVRVVLTADPGVCMEDIEDQEPPRRKEHRRVPSTVAMEEVKVRFEWMLLVFILLLALFFTI